MSERLCVQAISRGAAARNGCTSNSLHCLRLHTRGAWGRAPPPPACTVHRAPCTGAAPERRADSIARLTWPAAFDRPGNCRTIGLRGVNALLFVGVDMIAPQLCWRRYATARCSADGLGKQHLRTRIRPDRISTLWPRLITTTIPLNQIMCRDCAAEGKSRLIN